VCIDYNNGLPPKIDLKLESETFDHLNLYIKNANASLEETHASAEKLQ